MTNPLAQDLGGVVLLPCPGCGGTSTRVIGGPGTRGGPQYWAGCDHCRWRTWGDTEADAIAAWNTRAHSAEIGTSAPYPSTTTRSALAVAGVHE